jgi:DNA gyrase/topoisomerase IV subunit A
LTKSNTIKRLDIEDFLTVNQSGLIYSKIKPEDEVMNVSLVPHNLDVVICSDKKALRIKSDDIPLFKRNATGSKAMDTVEPIEGLTVIYPESNYIVALTKNGKCNKFDINMFQRHARARKGSNVLKLDKTDEIFGIYAANDSDVIRVITSEGVEEIKVADIKDKSPLAAGTKMISSKGIIVKADVMR